MNVSQIHDWLSTSMRISQDFLSQTALSLGISCIWYLLILLVVWMSTGFGSWQIVIGYLSIVFAGFFLLVAINYFYSLSDYSYYSGIVTGSAIVGTQLIYWILNRERSI